MLYRDLELFFDDVSVVAGPHSGPAGARPEVRPDPHLWARWPNLLVSPLIAGRVVVVCPGPLLARRHEGEGKKKPGGCTLGEEA